ncbi:MAG: hypothetical protein M1597_00545 [Candidatus Thermoplasmatota archaeon]|nr:hypothetical protein [Candidatus Thermoplasmatota archaeon]
MVNKNVTATVPYDLDMGTHSVHSLCYHFIQVAKCRKNVGTGGSGRHIKNMFRMWVGEE